MGFTRLKKNEGIHDTLRALWANGTGIPSEGDVRDFPPSMIESWVKDWGADQAASLARFLSQDPLTTIRFHRRAYGEDGTLLPGLRDWLSSPELPKSRGGRYSSRARIFKGHALVQRNEWFKQGAFEIQDEGSQIMSLFALDPALVAPVLADSPRTEGWKGEAVLPNAPFPALTVVDACAGAGGKTLALADLLQGRGRVYAYDVFERKVKSLKERVNRAEERNIQARLLPREGEKGLEGFHRSADVVLVDAPCSGLGVLRRNPDAKWNRKPLSLERKSAEVPIGELQQTVLRDYSRLVRPGGRLVFGVCTFTRAETTDAVETFLQSHPGFVKEESGFIGPYDTDGFYMCSLKAEE
jgi:16S rRNA (cytosine967-C5)-methyltransferase